MWPWGHLAAGYLLYTVLIHVRYQRSPHERATVALAIGTQLPDLVDKPLAWTLAILPHGRSLGHSLFTAVGLVLLVSVLVGRWSSGVVGAFAFGYLSHLFTDALPSVMAGEYSDLRFLVWPLIPAVEYQTRPSFVGHVLDVELTPYFLLQFGIAALTVAIWLYDRRPGLQIILSIPRFVHRKW